MRAFLAIALPQACCASLAQLQRQLKRAKADVKWVEPQQLHVTLKFLGEISEPQRLRVEVLLRDVARGASPLHLALDQLGAFPSLSAPRVIWVSLRGDVEWLSELVKRLERELAACGFPSEDRPFAAHITLGRVRSSRGRSALVSGVNDVAWHPPEPWIAHEMILYHSELSSAGPRYTVLAEIPLRPQSTDYSPQ